MSKTAAFLSRERDAILEAADAALSRRHARHYESAGKEEVQRRLASLFDQLLQATESRDLATISGYAEGIARERFTSGYDLSEVQTAFNALEEATWTRAIAMVDAEQLAEALGMVTTVLGAGKDALAREYVSLAANTRVSSLDLRALFAGTEGT